MYSDRSEERLLLAHFHRGPIRGCSSAPMAAKSYAGRLKWFAGLPSRSRRIVAYVVCAILSSLLSQLFAHWFATARFGLWPPYVRERRRLGTHNPPAVATWGRRHEAGWTGSAGGAGDAGPQASPNPCAPQPQKH